MGPVKVRPPCSSWTRRFCSACISGIGLPLRSDEAERPRRISPGGGNRQENLCSQHAGKYKSRERPPATCKIDNNRMKKGRRSAARNRRSASFFSFSTMRQNRLHYFQMNKRLHPALKYSVLLHFLLFYFVFPALWFSPSDTHEIDLQHF